MKLALVSSVILAGAGLAAANINAVEEPTRNVLPNVRFGHAVPAKVTQPAKLIMITTTTYTSSGPGAPCGRSRFRAKAIQMANVFRKLVGLKELTVTGPSHGHPMRRPYHHAGEKVPPALPMPFIGAGTPTHDFVNLEGIPLDPPRVHHGHHGHLMHHQTFSARLNKALMSLGPWEGGAVAFVLGCGIGVLLRMLFVLFIVAFRGTKSCHSTEHEYTQIVVHSQMDGEEIILPPPQYTDEKVEAEDAKIMENLRALSVV